MHFWGDGLIHMTLTTLLWIGGIALLASLVWVFAYNVARSRVLKQKTFADAFEVLKHPSTDESVFKSESEQDRDPFSDIEYGFMKKLSETDFDRAYQTVSEALLREGFRTLTEIDVAATLKERLGVDFRRYMILGACNPSLAHESLSHEPHIGLLLPCNVVLQEKQNGDLLVSIADPKAFFKLSGNPEVHYAMLKAERRLKQAIETM